MFNPKEILPFNCSELDRSWVEAVHREAEITIAGEKLVALRRGAEKRQPRIFTGRIGRKRGWRGMRILVPGGHLGNLIVARRGLAVVYWTDPSSVQGNRIGYFHVADLQRFKNPAAVILGSRKRGVVERPSSKKARAARANGARPVRPGSRPRGRPRHLTMTVGEGTAINRSKRLVRDCSRPSQETEL